MMRSVHVILAAFLAAFAASCAHAQQPIQMRAASHPSKNALILRQLAQVRELANDPIDVREGTEFRLTTELAYGLTSRLALEASVAWFDPPSAPSGSGVDDGRGLGDLDLDLKYRVFQRDSSAVDTDRISLFAGAAFPVGRAAHRSGGVAPFIGAVWTRIRGRHGVNASASWRFTTGDSDVVAHAGQSTADVLRLDGSYLYRLAPAAYGTELEAAWYAVAELNGLWETNDDHEIIASLGLLYEAPNVAFEVALQLPVVTELDERPEMEWGVVAGFRFLF